MDEDGRKKMDNFLREMEGTFPNKVFYIRSLHQRIHTNVYCVTIKCPTVFYSYLNQDTIYEYYVDTKNRTWLSFEDKLPKGWRYNSK